MRIPKIYALNNNQNKPVEQIISAYKISHRKPD